MTARTRRRLRALRWALVAAYVLLCLEPAPLFASELRHGRFRVHAEEPLGGSMSAVLDRATARLAASGVDDPEATFRVYVCREAWRYRLLAPFSSGAFALTTPAHTIVVGRCDPACDRAFAGSRERSLSGVIAHEATHVLLDRRYGRFARLPRWKKEGLCDAVAGESSCPREEGLRLVREGRDDGSESFFYFRSRLLVEHLLRVDGLSVDELVRRELDERAVLERVRARLRR